MRFELIVRQTRGPINGQEARDIARLQAYSQRGGARLLKIASIAQTR
jgi:hypothetical protein